MEKTKRSKEEWIRRYVSFVFILFIITLGISFSIRANLGSSPISAPPYVVSLIPGIHLTMGSATIILHVILILLQILILRRNFEWRQLSQLLVSFIFGFYTDLTMWLTSPLQISSALPHYFSWPLQLIELLIGGAILAFGVACEVRCDAFLTAGEGFPLAIARVTKKDFGKVKMCTDTSLVALGVVLMLIFFHHWDWKMIGVGTLVSMLYVGFMVRQYSPHLSWLDKIFIPADERKTSTDERQKTTAEEAAVPFIITIAREYGSGGAALGELVSKKLGVDFYDQNIMDAAAVRLGYTTDFVKSKEQNISNAKLLELIFTDKSIPESWNPSQDDAIFNCESQIIHTFAMKKPCVIIGRCANWVLRDDDKAFSVFVTSKKEDAVKRIMDKKTVLIPKLPKNVLSK